MASTQRFQRGRSSLAPLSVRLKKSKFSFDEAPRAGLGRGVHADASAGRLQSSSGVVVQQLIDRA